MELTPLQRKARFVARAIEEGKTLEAAAQSAANCCWPHVKEGLLGKRVLSKEVQMDIAAYVGVPVRKLFPVERPVAAAV